MIESYEVLFELIVHHPDMSRHELCTRYQVDEQTLENFFCGNIKFEEPKELAWWRNNVRKTMRKHKKYWASKGFTPQDLLDHAVKKIGLSHELWMTNYWVRFDIAISGDGTLLEEIDKEI